ncbi:MAG: hypothetical protein WBY93_22420 [Candidatus Binatus sp.]
MIRKTIAGLLVTLAFAATATIAAAAGPGGGGVGGGVGSIGSMGAISMSGMAFSGVGIARIGRGGGGGGVRGMGGLANFPFPTNDPNHYHEIKLIGRLAQDPSGLTVDQQIVRMRVDGRTIPMAIDGDSMSNSLQLDQGDELGQDLYRLILSRQLEVVGDQKLRTQIANAAANPENSKPIQVDGFVYDRMTPYLVLVSVGNAP